MTAVDPARLIQAPHPIALTAAGKRLADALVKAGMIYQYHDGRFYRADDCDDDFTDKLDAAAEILMPAEGAGLRAYLTAQMDWSRRAFGDRSSAIGLTKHIEKECAEVRANPHDLTEWVDIIILALDGYWRHGGTPDTIAPDLAAKQAKNFAREWPVNENPDEPNEHDRSGEATALASPQPAVEGPVAAGGADESAATDGPLFVHDFADPAVSSNPSPGDVTLSCDHPATITVAFMGNGLTGTLDEARANAAKIARLWNASLASKNGSSGENVEVLASVITAVNALSDTHQQALFIAWVEGVTGRKVDLSALLKPSSATLTPPADPKTGIKVERIGKDRQGVSVIFARSEYDSEAHRLEEPLNGLVVTLDVDGTILSLDIPDLKADMTAPVEGPADPKPTVPGNDAGMREALWDAMPDIGSGPELSLRGIVRRHFTMSHGIADAAVRTAAYLAALAPQTGSAGEDPKTPGAGVLADKIKLKLDEPSFSALGKEIGGNVTEPGYLLAFKVRPTGTDSLIVRLASGRDTIVGENEWTPAPVGEDETGVREALAYFLVERQHGTAAADYVREKNCGSWQAAFALADAMIAGPLAGALANQPPKAETPAGWGKTPDLDAISAEYERRYAAVPEAARRFASNTWGEAWSHAEMGSLLDFAALSAAPAARPGDGVERVRHVKRGTEYEVLGEAEAQVSTGFTDNWGTGRSLRDGMALTVYRDPKSGKLWCRFTDEMRDGRFVTLDPSEGAR